MKLFLKIIYWLVLTLVLLVALFVVFTAIPFPGNFRMYVVRSGSMAPAIKTGSLIVVKPAADYKVGDVITFHMQNATKKSDVETHRIFEIKNSGGEQKIITKGDANNAPDTAEVSKEQIVGKSVFKVPYLGYPIGFAKTLPGLVLLIVIPGTIIVYGEILNIVKEIKKRKKNKKGHSERSEESPEIKES